MSWLRLGLNLLRFSFFKVSINYIHGLYPINKHPFVPQRAEAAPKQAVFIIEEWVPKLVTTLLTRQYDWQRTSFSEVVLFLGMLRSFLEENLPLHGHSEVGLVSFYSQPYVMCFFFGLFALFL